MQTTDGRRVKVVPGAGIKSYDVLVQRGDGNRDAFDAVGEVRYWEQRYNLRRVFVARGWQAWIGSGEHREKVAFYATQSGAWPSRAAAVAEVLRAAGIQVQS